MTADNQLVNQTWDSFGRPQHTRFGNGGVQTSLTYDGVSRVNTFGHTFTDTSHNLTLTYGYNVANQITLREFGNKQYLNPANKTLTGDYQVNGLNQYRCHGSVASDCAGGEWLNYDSKGNLTRFDGISSLFDAENRLIRRTHNGIETHYTYDPMGRLVKAVKGSDVVELVYDGDALIAEYNAANTMTHRYVHGSRVDNPLVSYDGIAIGTSHRTYLHADHQGSIVAHSDNSGNRTQHNTYDEYGIPGSTNAGRFAYTGQIVLPFTDADQSDSVLYHYKARVYHPHLGRFMQTDPIGYEDQVNLYAYVHNDPMTFVDPTGEAGHVAIFAGIGALIGGGVEAMKQAKSGNFDLKRIGIEMLKGGAVGAATAFGGGVGAAITEGASTVATVTAVAAASATHGGSASFVVNTIDMAATGELESMDVIGNTAGDTLGGGSNPVVKAAAMGLTKSVVTSTVTSETVGAAAAEVTKQKLNDEP